jgi:predicted N-acetyltransferase YhbS
MAIVGLHERAFGPGRFALTAYRIREGTPPLGPLCYVAELAGRLVASVRLTPIEIGGTGGALLLGPLAVEPGFVGKGHGRALIDTALAAARAAGFKLIVLVGDASYYGRFGFAVVRPGQIELPGPVDQARILALELDAGALGAFMGLIRAAEARG